MQWSRAQRHFCWLGAAGLFLWVFAPTLAWGPIAEDLQWAYKGWTARHNPASFFQPFHQHYRPAVLALFAFAANVFGDWWLGYRVLAWVLLAVLLWVAARFLKQRTSLPEWLVPSLFVTWLVSPLADEVLFVTCEAQQVLYAIGVLWTLGKVDRSGRQKGFWWALTLAFASKEEAIVLLPLLVAQDRLLFGLSWRQVLRRALPLATFCLAFLAAYKALTAFQASWFYQNPWLAPLNFGTTWPAFWHFHGPVLGKYAVALQSTWPWMVLSLVATALLLLATFGRDRMPAFGFVAAGLSLLPTLPANLQVPRYTFLPYFFFLAAVLSGALALVHRMRRRWLTLVFVLGWFSALVNDVSVARADRQDWDRFRRLSVVLEEELEPVLDALRQGKGTLLVRGADTLPLSQLYRSPRGIAKVYFPRPDDPYGVVSVSAVVSWKLRREGVAAVRCHGEGCPQPQAAFRHEVGGFLPMEPTAPLPGELFGAGRVLLAPLPARSFHPQAFP